MNDQDATRAAGSSAPACSANWIPTTEKQHPDKPGLARYEQIPCLVVYHGEICIRQWNCQHLVWDEEDGDDFCCKVNEVTHWMPLPPMPNMKGQDHGNR